MREAFPTPTGKTWTLSYRDKRLTLCNQRCRAWTHPYAEPGKSGATLSSAGCGIFSLYHAIHWMHNDRPAPDVEALADFSVTHGGRGDDGTDRPKLLAALVAAGEAARLGFDYHGDGLLNDHDALYTHLSTHKGVALANLRVGHIVALVDAWEEAGEKRLLAIDCHSESDHARFGARVSSCVPDSAVVCRDINPLGVEIGQAIHYAMFVVPLDVAMDFNLLYQTEPEATR